MDPLAIGATDDESKKHRDTLTLEIPTRQPRRRRLPRRARPGRRRDRGGAARARGAGRRTDLRRASRRQVEHRGRDRQPVPPHALFQAPPGRVRRDRRGGSHGRPRRVRERQGLPDVRVGHGAEDRAREPGADGGERLGLPPERPPEPRRLHVRRRLVGRHARLAAQRGRLEPTSRSRSARPRRTTGARAAAAS